MIKVVAKNALKEGVRDEVLTLLEEMIAKTRQEDGCIKYELYELDGDPNVLTFIEEWESMDKLSAHMNSEHFKRIIPLLGDYKASVVPVEIYTLLR
jgi:quinol monooxygenase YgiN